MNTVKDLIAKLQTIPQDAIVQVSKGFSDGWHHGTKWEELDLTDEVEFIDIKSKNFPNGVVEIGLI